MGQLRLVRRLKQRKYRQSDGLFLAEGRQAVREAIKASAVAVIVSDQNIADHVDLIEFAQQYEVPVLQADAVEVKALSDTVTPQGIIATCKAVDVPLDACVQNGELVVICAQVRDPGNAGTVIRCADAFGADAVILTSDSVDVTNPKCVRASVGSIFHVPITVGASLADAVETCRKHGMQILAADGGGQSLTDVDLSIPTAWIMGNEAWGLPAEHVALADQVVSVPMVGQAESLNLSTAAAVCLFSTANAQSKFLE